MKKKDLIEAWRNVPSCEHNSVHEMESKIIEWLHNLPDDETIEEVKNTEETPKEKLIWLRCRCGMEYGFYPEDTNYIDCQCGERISLKGNKLEWEKNFDEIEFDMFDTGTLQMVLKGFTRNLLKEFAGEFFDFIRRSTSQRRQLYMFGFRQINDFKDDIKKKYGIED